MEELIIRNHSEQLESQNLYAAFMVRNLKRTRLSRGAVLPWREVVTNIGGHYNPRSYSFVCPVHGVYQFNLAILSADRGGGPIGAMIVKNSDIICKLWADIKHTMGSNSAVIECLAGDAIRVKNFFHGEFHNDNHHYNTFSGSLLKRL